MIKKINVKKVQTFKIVLNSKKQSRKQYNLEWSTDEYEDTKNVLIHFSITISFFLHNLRKNKFITVATTYYHIISRTEVIFMRLAAARLYSGGNVYTHSQIVFMFPRKFPEQRQIQIEFLEIIKKKTLNKSVFLNKIIS